MVDKDMSSRRRSGEALPVILTVMNGKYGAGSAHITGADSSPSISIVARRVGCVSPGFQSPVMVMEPLKCFAASGIVIARSRLGCGMLTVASHAIRAADAAVKAGASRESWVSSHNPAGDVCRWIGLSFMSMACVDIVFGLRMFIFPALSSIQRFRAVSSQPISTASIYVAMAVAREAVMLSSNPSEHKAITPVRVGAMARADLTPRVSMVEDELILNVEFMATAWIPAWVNA